VYRVRIDSQFNVFNPSKSMNVSWCLVLRNAASSSPERAPTTFQISLMLNEHPKIYHDARDPTDKKGPEAKLSRIKGCQLQRSNYWRVWLVLTMRGCFWCFWCIGACYLVDWSLGCYNSTIPPLPWPFCSFLQSPKPKPNTNKNRTSVSNSLPI
jgi:hypothetical protein